MCKKINEPHETSLWNSLRWLKQHAVSGHCFGSYVRITAACAAVSVSVNQRSVPCVHRQRLRNGTAAQCRRRAQRLWPQHDIGIRLHGWMLVRQHWCSRHVRTAGASTLPIDTPKSMSLSLRAVLVAAHNSPLTAVFVRGASSTRSNKPADPQRCTAGDNQRPPTAHLRRVKKKRQPKNTIRSTYKAQRPRSQARQSRQWCWLRQRRSAQITDN